MTDFTFPDYQRWKLASIFAKNTVDGADQIRSWEHLRKFRWGRESELDATRRYIESLPTISPAFAEHILRTRQPTLHALLVERAADLPPRIVDRLLKSRQPSTRAAIREARIFEHGTAAGQKAWVEGAKERQDIDALLGTERAAPEAVEHAIEALLAGDYQYKLQALTGRNGQTIVANLGFDRAVDLLAADVPTGLRAAMHIANGSERMVELLEKWRNTMFSLYRELQGQRELDDDDQQTVATLRSLTGDRDGHRYVRELDPEISKILSSRVVSGRDGLLRQWALLEESGFEDLDFTKISTRSDGRAWVVQHGSLDELLEEFQNGGPYTTDEIRRIADYDGYSSHLSIFLREAARRAPKSDLLTEQVRIMVESGQRVPDEMIERMRIEDAAELFGLRDILSNLGGELADYLASVDNKVPFSELLDAAKTIPATLAQLVAIVNE